ncbi:LPS-assembly protein LptD [Roseimicrobium sp. ORNL1]|uniref:LPS-assembly protein LptD n=1 Tax=Roseimicrobium sp. ORNL1 TaxID=2711231 RepID=UPI0013E0F5AA|nr:LPS-assembly protein LptD [Roseimicrobium sp. ORNL1]QIF03974.1 LPS-assembly protein LptD [Roseimicrobium sp. ORNL1]
MKHVLPLLGCVLLAAASVQGQSSDILGTLTSNINIEGLETSFDPTTGIATAKGDVYIKYEDTEIKAAQADYNSTTGDVIAKGNVVVVKQGNIYRGENITYNVKTQELSANNIRSALPPIFYQAEDFQTNAGELKRIDGTDSYFTTHDAQSPNYRVKAKSITIYPEDRIVMKHVKVYLGNTPVFYLPYIVQPLNDELGYFFQPGYTSQWGVFLLNQYGVMHGDHTLAKYHLDLRSERGVGVGADFQSMKWKKLGNDNFGHLTFYYAYDTNPEEGVNDSIRPDSLVDENRYRIGFQHRIFIPGPAESTWYLDFDLTKLSDQFMLEDYYLNDFRINPEPDNHVKLVHRDDRFTATLLARFQMNDFYHTDTRLPELAFDFTRSRIANTNFYYQGETTLGAYADKLSENEQLILQSKIAQQRAVLNSFGSGSAPTATVIGPDGVPTTVPIVATELAGTTLTSNNSAFLRATPRQLFTRDDVEQDLEALQGELNENKFFRFHSYHEVLYPMSFGANNFINFVPRIGGGATYYGDVEGGTEDIDSDTRPLFQIGFDLSAKFSKTWDDVHNRTLGLDGLRHIVQPYVNYSYLDAGDVEGLPTVDRLTPSTRPRPIDVPLFTATDSFHTWNVARIGVRNLFQTKRDEATHNWAGLNTYMDIFMEDPEFDRSVSNLYNDLFWYPVPWLAFTIDSQLPIGNSDFNFTEVNSAITWMPSKRLSFTLGHQLLSDNPLFIDSSLIYSRVYAKINENWGFSMNHIYEMDDSTLEYQSYSIHRDLASWTMALGGLVRDNRGENEYGLVLSFTLKDFPNVSIPLDLDPNPTGRGGSE